MNITEPSVYPVFIYALITAVATGIGAIPFILFKKIDRKWLGVSNAAAIGLMLAASFSLIYEGIEYSLWKTIAGIIIGMVFITYSSRYLHRFESITVANMNKPDAKKALLFLAIMTLHSFTEGIGVGVSFAGGIELGIFITIAIAVHNIPEGLAISLVSVPRGLNPWKSAGWGILSSLPQPLMAVPAFLFVEEFKLMLPIGLGFASGAMIWMVFSELIPETTGEISSNKAAIIITIAIAGMIIFQEIIRSH
jgi:zinc transporter, ZIP family